MHVKLLLPAHEVKIFCDQLSLRWYYPDQVCGTPGSTGYDLSLISALQSLQSKAPLEHVMSKVQKFLRIRLMAQFISKLKINF